MSNTIALIHTTSLVLEPVKKSLESFSSQYDFLHLLDEALLCCMMEEGNTPQLTIPWLDQLVANAACGGAEGAIVSCSSLSTSVAAVAENSDIPVEAIDTALYHHVLKKCGNPVVLMTNPTNREPAAYMQNRLGSHMPVVLCSGAFEALKDGDREKHDRQVLSEIESLLHTHDGILLSQISMERVRSLLSDELRMKVYSSLDFLEETIREMKL